MQLRRYWRSRMGKLNSIIEQLKTEECRVILAVLQVSAVLHALEYKV